MPFADRRLVDMAGQDQLGPRVDEPCEHAGAIPHGLLSRPPRRAEQVVVEHDDPQRTRRCFGEAAGGVLQLRRADAPGLVEPGTD